MVQEHVEAKDLVVGKTYSILTGKRVTTGVYEGPIAGKYLFWLGTSHKQLGLVDIMKPTEEQHAQ